MQRLELLKRLSFGALIAEDEVQELGNYFVETHQWEQIESGKIDIIRGEKGAGKSAIYSLLTTKVDQLFDRGILLVAAERPRGATVFKDLVTDPPTDEQEFIWLWKIYILTIVAQKLREYEIGGADANKVYAALEEAKLLERGMDLSALLRRAQHFVRYLRRLELQAGLEFDPATGAPSAYIGKITLREPEFRLREQGFNSIDDLFKHANAALARHKYNVWVLLDRLDVAFADNHKLEANALRALLRVYGDMRAFDRISLKIFLREDIWKRIFEKGFREASHLTDMAVVLEWSTSALQNLVVRRLLSNQILLDEFRIDRRAVLGNAQAQDDMVKRLFPPQVEQGPQKPTTFNWMVSRCADATRKTAPRELIHLLKSIQEREIQRLERGGLAAPDDQLFDRTVFKLALVPVSAARLHQYLYAEYPDERAYLEALERAKTEQTPDSLAKIWRLDEKAATEKAEELREIGFFERRGDREHPTYWVPFLYRDALDMIQGKAEEEEG